MLTPSHIRSALEVAAYRIASGFGDVDEYQRLAAMMPASLAYYSEHPEPIVVETLSREFSRICLTIGAQLYKLERFVTRVEIAAMYCEVAS